MILIFIIRKKSDEGRDARCSMRIQLITNQNMINVQNAVIMFQTISLFHVLAIMRVAMPLNDVGESTGDVGCPSSAPTETVKREDYFCAKNVRVAACKAPLV